MENKRKRSIVDIGDDNLHIQKILKGIENPYDADDEDSASESESHVKHILGATNYFAAKVDKFEAEGGYLLKNVSVYDTLSPNINNCEDSFTDNGSEVEDHDLNECQASVPLDYCEPEVNEFAADSGYMLEYPCYNSTWSPNNVNSENYPTVGDFYYPELHVKERIDAVLIDNISPVIDLTSMDDLLDASESTVITLDSDPDSEYLLKNISVYDTLSPNINNCEDSFTDNGSQVEDHDLNECQESVPLDYCEPEVNEFAADSGYMLEYPCYNSTLSPNIVNSENYPTVGDFCYPELHVKQRIDAVLIDNISPVIDLTSMDDVLDSSESTVIILDSDPEEEKT